MEVSKWIQKYPRISWEPEILVSAGILFSLFQFQNALVHVDNYLYPLGIAQGNQETILIMISFGISALTVGFSLHLISKAFWISLLALKSVYPKGIRNEKLNYSETFVRREKIDFSLDSKISKIGNVASLIFSVSFLSLFLFLGLTFYTIILIVISNLLNLNFSVDAILLITLALPFVDFVTLGILKKSELPSKVYYPYYKVVSFLTLSFLYREIFYTLISNNSKLNIVLFSLFYLMLTAILVFYNTAPITGRSISLSNWNSFNTFDGSIIERNYENLRPIENRIWTGTIQSDVISGNTVKLYLKYQHWMDNRVSQLHEENKTLSQDQIIKQNLQVYIDEIAISDIAWLATHRSDINQFGLISYIPVSNLKSGLHRLVVKREEGTPFFEVSFWKE